MEKSNTPKNDTDGNSSTKAIQSMEKLIAGINEKDFRPLRAPYLVSEIEVVETPYYQVCPIIQPIKPIVKNGAPVKDSSSLSTALDQYFANLAPNLFTSTNNFTTNPKITLIGSSKAKKRCCDEKHEYRPEKQSVPFQMKHQANNKTHGMGLQQNWNYKATTPTPSLSTDYIQALNQRNTYQQGTGL